MASVAQPWLISRLVTFPPISSETSSLNLVLLTRSSRFVDPIFAIGVGLSAAYLRISREEREQYPEQDSSPTGLWQKGVRMSRSYFGHETIDGKK